MKILKILGIAFALVLISVSPVSAAESSITKELVCQCGCLMVLGNCSHAECHSRDEMTAIIAQKLAKGESREQIIQYFVAQYGEQVLSAPTKQGFNLTAWITPFAAIIFGGGIIYVALKAWLQRGQSSPITTATTAEADDEYRRRLEKELAEFQERGFR